MSVCEFFGGDGRFFVFRIGLGSTIFLDQIDGLRVVVLVERVLVICLWLWSKHESRSSEEAYSEMVRSLRDWEMVLQSMLFQSGMV